MRTECADSKGARGGDTRADSSNSEMNGKVLDARCAVHSDEDDESDGRDTHAADDEGCADASAVR